MLGNVMLYFDHSERAKRDPNSRALLNRDPELGMVGPKEHGLWPQDLQTRSPFSLLVLIPQAP